MRRPGPDEFAPMFQAYIERVPDGDILAMLRQQGERTHEVFASLTEEQGDYAYASGKWSVKRLLQHLADGERMFCYRAMCIARGDTASLPGFDEVAYAELDGSDTRPLRDIVADFGAVRAATLTLFEGFDADAWGRRGVANGNPISALALPWLIAGHELHHLAVLRDRYELGRE